jgi:hypothetical protein
MELEVTWGRATRVWFAYFWRNLLALGGGLILGGLLGFVLGMLWQAAGVPPEMGQKVSMLVGAVVGLAVSIIPIRLILGKDFGEFRLVLLANHPAPSESHIGRTR